MGSEHLLRRKRYGVDDVLNDDGRIFTITTDDDNVFYLIVDRRSDDQCLSAKHYRNRRRFDGACKKSDNKIHELRYYSRNLRRRQHNYDTMEMNNHL